MTIEELKALKDWVESCHKNSVQRFDDGVCIVIDDVHGDKFDAVIELIDAETERQSVTDEDVAEAPEREPCDWCEAQMQNVMGYVQYGCLRLDASCWNFCPVCGRKLEKAVPV